MTISFTDYSLTLPCLLIVNNSIMLTAALHTALGHIGFSPAAHDAAVHQGFIVNMDLIV